MYTDVYVLVCASTTNPFLGGALHLTVNHKAVVDTAYNNVPFIAPFQNSISEV